MKIKELQKQLTSVPESNKDYNHAQILLRSLGCFMGFIMKDRREEDREGFGRHVKTRELVKQHCNINQLREEDMVLMVFDNYLLSGAYKKFIPGQVKLSTYLSHVTLNQVKYIVRNKINKNKKHGSLTDFEEVNASGDSKLGERLGSSIDYWEMRGAPGLCNPTTPEDIQIGKESYSATVNHFGELDTSVLLGEEDRKSAAKKLSCNYDAYRQQFLRKSNSFRSQLSETGYLN